MPTSPDVQNYQYGAGSCYIKLEDDMDYRHVGNVPELTYSSDITKQEHKQSMAGLKSTDLEVITEVAASINITLEEVTPENMALFIMGTFEENTDGDLEAFGLELTSIVGDFKYVSANATGRQIEMYARVSITPNGDFSFIQDNINTIPLTLKVLKDDDKFARWVVKAEEESA